VAELCSLKVKYFYEDAGYWILDFTIKGSDRSKSLIILEKSLMSFGMESLVKEIRCSIL